MNAPLRRRHRVVLLSIAVVLPILFAASISGRHAVPIASEVPSDPRVIRRLEALPRGAGRELDVEGTSGATWRVRTDGERLAIVQIRGERLPDLLAYWSSTEAQEDLPADVVLLGPVSTLESTFSVPHARGVLILFALAHGEIAGQIRLEAR